MTHGFHPEHALGRIEYGDAARKPKPGAVSGQLRTISSMGDPIRLAPEGMDAAKRPPDLQHTPCPG